MPITTNPNDPRLGHGSDNEPRPQQEVYLVLSDEERAKGFVYDHLKMGFSPRETWEMLEAWK